MKTTMTNLKKYFLDLIRPQELDAIREEEKAKGNDKLMADLECLWNEETWRELSLDIADRRSLDMSKKAVFGVIDKSSSTNNPGKRESARVVALRFVSTAAVALLIFTFLLAWKQHELNASLMSSVVETRTSPGDTTLVRMPDGTLITVSGGSILAYPMAFSSTNRKVSLRGEAYFSVAHDATHPFVVEGNGFDVTVRGTRFNLRTRQADGQSTLWLDEGIVDIKSEKTGQRMTLRPGQQARINTETGWLAVSQTDRNGVKISWLDHKMSFRDTPLYDVLATVCANYGLTLDMAKNINNLPFTGTLPNNSISEVVETLEIVYKVKIKVSGKVMSVERVNID